MVTQTLIDKAKAGDTAAFEQIYNETIKGAYYVARKFLGSDTAVEDILQETYIKVYEKLGEYKTGNFQGWVDVIVANRCKDYLKKKNPVLFSQMESEDDEVFEREDTREEFRPDIKVDYDETKRLVEEIIDKLPADQKISVFMYYYEQMSVKEIATTLECSENTIKSRLNYGRKTIKEEVEKLEKNGTKLYCAPILPFILWLFREEAKASQVPSGLSYGNVMAQQILGTAATGANMAAAAAVKVGMSVGAKIGIGALAAVVAAGGITAAVYLGGDKTETANGKPAANELRVNMEDYEDEEETAGTDGNLSRSEIDDIVEKFVEEYVKINRDEAELEFALDGISYAYFWQGERPVILMRDYRNAHGNADDAYDYHIYRVDVNTGEVIAYDEVPEIFSYVEPEDEFLYNEEGFLLKSWWMQVWCMEEISDDSIIETELTESEYMELYGNYKPASFTVLDLEPIIITTEPATDETTQAETTADENGDRWNNQDTNPLLQGDCPVYCEYPPDIFFLPCTEGVFTDNGWKLRGSGSGEWLCYHNERYPGYELYLQHVDGDDTKICGIKMDIYGLEEPPFYICIGSVNFSCSYNDFSGDSSYLKTVLGESVSETVEENGHRLQYRQGDWDLIYRTYMDNETGKETVKYMEIYYNP